MSQGRLSGVKGDYRIVFEPGPGDREVTVFLTGHRSWVYEELEPGSDSA